MSAEAVASNLLSLENEHSHTGSAGPFIFATQLNCTLSLDAVMTADVVCGDVVAAEGCDIAVNRCKHKLIGHS